MIECKITVTSVILQIKYVFILSRAFCVVDELMLLKDDARFIVKFVLSCQYYITENELCVYSCTVWSSSFLQITWLFCRKCWLLFSSNLTVEI
jgi:hypothetical protein